MYYVEQVDGSGEWVRRGDACATRAEAERAAVAWEQSYRHAYGTQLKSLLTGRVCGDARVVDEAGTPVAWWGDEEGAGG